MLVGMTGVEPVAITTLAHYEPAPHTEGVHLEPSGDRADGTRDGSN